MSVMEEMEEEELKRIDLENKLKIVKQKLRLAELKQKNKYLEEEINRIQEKIEITNAGYTSKENYERDRDSAYGR